MSDHRIAKLQNDFERRFAEICALAGLVHPPCFAVAYSGGLDSSVLLQLAQSYARQAGISLYAFHIHHGLSPNADSWLQHCNATCAALGVAFDSRRVTLGQGGGIEEAARLARYAALGELCQTHGVPLLLTAHHQDDQAETVLLQLLRGSGVAGLAGMESANRAPDMLGSDAVIGRPLLEVARSKLEEAAAAYGLSWIEDESNRDHRFVRNALRHRVMPELEAAFPGFQHRIARSAQHAQAAQQVLTMTAAQDFELCRAGNGIDVAVLATLATDRANNLLRYWFAQRGMRMPSTAWLDEMRNQILGAKEDAQICVTHADCVVRRHRGAAYLTPRLDGEEGPAPHSFVWNGEPVLQFPTYRGSLHFDVALGAEEGVSAVWLRGRPCVLHRRQGGERLKLAANRPSRDLKHHYQTHGIPAWERPHLPLVSCEGELLFAAGLGTDSSHLSVEGVRVRLRWESNLA
ncbi:MAG: tRNA lysidine(34) synthetase TilS [Burkholderiaceae bacterium]|nr:tRNA lysidine(34) synthetase TilS [Burkholderiaceae bacterium]